MRDALRQLQPDRIEDLIALVALYRPGPMKNIELFCKRRHGKALIAVSDGGNAEVRAAMETILEETYGIVVYQEQVMEIARSLAGFSLAEADNLRRAMGKKLPAEMKSMKQAFVSGLRKKFDLQANIAAAIFKDIAEFANYGFNKSHAACYALVSYQTAYLKAYYPVEFFAAWMNMEIGGAQDEKMALFRNEALRHGVDVLPPCVNRSSTRFRPERGGVTYALSAIKGLGAIETGKIEQARREGGPFTSLFDFARRVDLRTRSRAVLERLASAGAFDALEPNRARVMAVLADLVSYSRAGA